MLWDSVWDIGCNIFGFIAMIGPLLLVGWYFKAAKEKFRKLNEQSKNN
ncbi:MAG TPA: hypothetical protein PLD22_01905 [Bacillota bacterium]|jgi:glucose uptake protein GlcU|nr:hypothetical protein [Bacillota bacterium]